MNSAYRPSGIDCVGVVPWGAHFCQFYRSEADLAEILVPYFLAGLRSNESCLWVTSQKLPAESARRLLLQAEPGLDRYIGRGQMEIVSISDWYRSGDTFDADAVLTGWIAREERSRSQGYDGLRLTGDTAWIERSGWADFMDYEGKVSNAFRPRNMVALCTYCLDSCTAEDVIEVCHHHEFALTRRKGVWEQLESASLKIAREELHRANSELEDRVQKRTAELNAALQARDEFLAMLGHELRNPLAPIRMATDVFLKKFSSDKVLLQSANILDRQVGHLSRLVDDLLDVARIAQGHVQLKMEERPLSQALALAAEQVKPFIAQRGHKFLFESPPAYVVMRYDLNRLAQVFGNLLHNAAKYTPPGGTISLLSHKEGNEVVVTVRDNGSGIPPDKLRSVFDLFTQLPRSLDRAEGGLGIGLTLAQRLTEMHGGTITAFSEGVGKGAEFSVRLKLFDQATTPTEEKRRLLVVDDNADIADVLKALLDIYGFEVLAASSGEEALASLPGFAPHIVLMDISLPDMNGFELAKRIRNNTGNTPTIIALSGYAKPGDMMLQDGLLDAYLVKPVEVDDLMSTIERHTPTLTPSS